MKRFFAFIVFITICVLCFASEVTNLLDTAKIEYKKGNFNSAIELIDSARKIIESEHLLETDREYIEIANWDVIDLKSEFYIGKKVKFIGSYWGVVGKDQISVELRSCTFENALIDKILMLQKTKTYTFYGTVMQQKYLSPYIHIEIIE